MISLDDMMAFPISEKNFMENNLLDTEDWDKGYLSHCENSTSSLSSDEFTSLESNSSPLQEDNIDSWLEEELSLTIPPDEASKHIEEPIYIKQEPSSPTNIYNNTLVFPSNISVKVPISRYKSGNATVNKVTSVNSGLQSIKDSVPMFSSVQSIPTNNTNTNIIQIRKLVPISSPDLSAKILSDQAHYSATMATIPYTTNNNVTVTVNSNHTAQALTLDNGQQMYFSQSCAKTEPLTNSKVMSKIGLKREASIKVEELLPPPKTLTELKNYKRQQRMIKNRESACLSRQRKKEHLKELQEHASKMAALNQELKEENDKLKERIQKLESENMILRESPMKTTMKEAAKKSTILLTIFIIFVFVPFRLSNRDNVTKRQIQMPLLHKGRSLLQFDNSNIHQEYIAYQNNAYDSRKIYAQRINIMNDIFDNGKDRSNMANIRRQSIHRKGFSVNHVIKSHIGHMPTGDVGCEEHFNKTHANRIKQALEGLAKGFAKEENLSSQHKYITNRTAVTDIPSSNSTLLVKSRSSNCNDSQPRHKPPRSINPRKLRKSKLRNLKPKESPTPKTDSQALFEIIQKSIQRRPDTFYVVSLLKDTLILPATSFNSTQRPKVTLMFPAQLPNNTVLNGSTDIPMLQIECNVIDTKLMRFQRDTKYLLT